MQIKIKTPAKINLSLDIIGKREDGYHEIRSIMQMINLYDYLTFDIEEAQENQIILSGNNDKIPYNDKNIIYKAIEQFIKISKVPPHIYKVYIEKNIPTEAGLAGGSSNAAGTLIALNSYFNDILDSADLHEICGSLGSDLNVILTGGCVLATGRGEKVQSLPFHEYPVSLIKPNIGISAKEGYKCYSELLIKPKNDNTDKIIKLLKNGQDIRKFISNDMEAGVFDKYKELRYIKKINPDSVMSGSGSTYFQLYSTINKIDGYWYKENLKTIPTGCEFIK